MVSVFSRVFWRKVKKYIKHHLNFYRIHILFFTFTPLIFSAIFYASNTEFRVSYVDSLFNCVSAVTVTGLATVDLSGLTPWQQVILLIQMCLGSPVFVSWVMVYVRRRFFKSKFRQMVKAELSRRISEKVDAPVKVTIKPWWLKFLKGLLPGRNQSLVHEQSSDGHSTPPRLRTDMIRRMDDAPKLVNPSGWISETQSPQLPPAPLNSAMRRPGQVPEERSPPHQLAFADAPENVQSISDETDSVLADELHTAEQLEILRKGRHKHDSPNRISDLEASSSNGDASDDAFQPSQMPRFPTISVAHATPHISPFPRTTTLPRTTTFPRSQTVEFAPDPRRRRVDSIDRGRRERRGSVADSNHQSERSQSRASLSYTATTHSHRASHLRTKHRNFGGFPMPHEIMSKLFHRFFPKLERQLTRTLTIPRTQTIVSQHGSLAPGARPVSYITFEAVVGRNSKFEQLTRDQLEELGGVEYRGLSALLWIVGVYHIGLQLIAFTVIAPYMSMSRWHNDFIPPTLHKYVASTWFSLFQVVSSYTNTGMSLEDTSMVPFQKAYPMIIIMIILILAGNTAFPVFLRFNIWIYSKLVPKKSRTHETLNFLLDHPRRCFIYLFPSHQTWFLLTVLIGLNGTDWFFFMVLDIGNPAIESIPLGTRFLLGLLQAAAVRAAGFGSVSLAALAPAVKVLYVLMMYISVYPVAMSIRSTNVYEERSLGIFHDERESMTEEDINLHGNRATVWSRYLAMHMRKQLSFDMWWLSLALFLVCIIERDALEDSAKQSWFTIFTILFELVSAYGTVGLSLGVPYASYSFSGALRPLSKLIVCLVMLRGRHRGLPVAIDRAVMLPVEFREEDSTPDTPDDEDYISEVGEEELGDDVGEGSDTSTHRSTTSLPQQNGDAAAAADALHEKFSAGRLDRASERRTPWRSGSPDSQTHSEFQRTSSVEDPQDLDERTNPST